jgi:ribosomal 30S subunit maturation factor RimM
MPGLSRAPRFLRLRPGESDSASLLRGCPVVTAAGERLGRVDYLMVDALTQQLRYVVLIRRRHAATVTIPWHALYFDSAAANLVFYTWD